ncbi:MAG TPA: DUF2683 domain-containing protein [Candidatus Pacearchaeota archaeon]|nr:DUF2683 domain-containing protein [Candidatus Pacearchaeota archaeon]
MVQNIINISERKDRILNIVKAQQGFKNKSQAIEFVLEIYTDSFLEPELKPEFINKLTKIQQEKGIPFNNIDELRALTGE